PGARARSLTPPHALSHGAKSRTSRPSRAPARDAGTTRATSASALLARTVHTGSGPRASVKRLRHEIWSHAERSHFTQGLPEERHSYLSIRIIDIKVYQRYRLPGAQRHRA